MHSRNRSRLYSVKCPVAKLRFLIRLNCRCSTNRGTRGLVRLAGLGVSLKPERGWADEFFNLIVSMKGGE